MKAYRLFSRLLIAGLVLMFSLVSCQKDYPPEREITIEDLNPQVVSSAQIPLYDLYGAILKDITEGNDPDKEDLIKWVNARRDALYKQAEAAAIAEGANDDYTNLTPAILAILHKMVLETRVISYSTLGAGGKMIESSMLVAWPWSPLVNPYPDHLILGCHATIAADRQRPSNYDNLSFSTDVRILVGEWASTVIALDLSTVLLDLITSPAECLVVMPDYEGYGNTSQKPHPYLNREIQARQCIDAAQAAVKWYEANEKHMDSGWKTVSIGYSQGGAVAAASYRYWLDHKTRYKSLNFAGAVCGDGPYDPYATLKFYVDRNEMDLPCAPALVIKGMMDTDKEMIAAGAKLEDYLTEDFIKTGIFEGIASKKYTPTDWTIWSKPMQMHTPGPSSTTRTKTLCPSRCLNPPPSPFSRTELCPMMRPRRTNCSC